MCIKESSRTAGAGRVEPVPLNIKTGSFLILNSKCYDYVRLCLETVTFACAVVRQRRHWNGRAQEEESRRGASELPEKSANETTCGKEINRGFQV